ncbi:MAG: ABC transporter ATP-binding protein [Candidatus Omnitrophota bacterium]
MQNVIEIINLSKNFTVVGYPWQKKKFVSALTNVSLAVKRGECFALLGPNGAGKTTLLRILSTLILPNSGSALVCGCRTGEDDTKIKSKIGIVTAEERSFYWRLTGRQNLEFFAAMYDLKNPAQRIEELFLLFKIDYADNRFSSYSAGMKHKFALMRGLLHNPPLLLLDEPTKSLDPTGAEELRNFIKEELVTCQGKTVFFTTHQIYEAEKIAGRIAIMDKGRIKACGTQEELKKIMNSPNVSLYEVYNYVLRIKILSTNI